MTHLQAPWTAEQVAHLNAYQQSGRMHPFTCGRRDRHPADPGVLVATEQGWHCPADGCDYRQHWALPFMAAPLPDDPAQELLARMRAERQAGRDAVAAVARVRALHHEYAFGDDPQVYCAHCNRISGGWAPWPCDTIKAIGEAS